MSPLPHPLTHERTFRIRHYECDAYGHLNHANYLRLMQEAAFDASAAAGYDLARYEELGTWWWIRATDITYHRPLTYGDAVVVKTWVADFKRVRSRRMYEFRHAVTGDLVAAAYSDWVYLDSESLRPVAIPRAMIDAFFPEGPPEETKVRKSLPQAPPPPPDVYTYRRTVAWHDLDMMRHVNNAVYLTYLEEAGFGVCEAYGWPVERMIEVGFGIVAGRYHLEYKQAARLGDELAIATWASHARRTTAYRHYVIRRRGDNALIGRASALWVWVDLQTGRPIRIPQDFVDDFRANVV